MILGFQVLVGRAVLSRRAGTVVHPSRPRTAAMFQSLGLRNHVWWPRIQFFAKAASIAIFIGYALIPIAIYMRVVGADYAKEKIGELNKPALVESAAPAGKETK